MIENKLLHYETRAAFEQDKPNIANTSIAFIDEGRTIYTWGKEYNSLQVQDEVESVQEEVEKIEREWQDALDEKVSQLTELVTQKHADAVSRARADIQNAQNTIAEVRQTLGSLQESCSTKKELEAVDGKITAITNWYNLQEQSLTELSQQLDAIEGRIVTEGTYTNIVNNAITNYNREVDLKIAQAKEEMSYANTDEMTEIVVGRLMDAENGVLKDYATLVKLGEEIDGVKADVSSQVTSELNALDPSWNTLVSRVATVEGTTQNLSTQYTSLSATVSGFSAITTRVQDHETRIAQIESNVGDDESKVTLAAVYKVVNEDVNKTIAAKIFAQANAQGSNITLSADKINLSGDTTVLGNFVASKISAADITAKALNITNTSTGNSIIANAIDGIKFTNGTTGRNTFKLNMNGSGQIGYRTVTEEVNGETVTTYEPAISWDANGNLIINSAIIGGGEPGGGGTTYIENPFDPTSLESDIDTLKTGQNTLTGYYNTLINDPSRAYLTGAGIVFDRSAVIDPVTNSGSIVAVTSTSTQNGTVPAGVSHTAVGGDLNGEHGYYLKNDGTGELAFGSIKWDKDGNLTVKNLNIEGTTFTSNESTKIFSIDYICCTNRGTIIKYTISSSGVVLKQGKLEFPDNSQYVSRSAIDTVETNITTFNYLKYRADKDWVSEWSTSYNKGFITPLYRWDIYFERVTQDVSDEVYNTERIMYEEEPDSNGNYPTEIDNRRLHTVYTWHGPIKYRYVNAESIMTFIAQRSFEYPVFDQNYNIIGHTKNMPNGGNWESSSIGWVDGAHGTADGYYTGIGQDIDDSRDPNDLYWQDVRHVSDGTYTGIKIDKRYRQFQDVMWKEIFSIPDSDLTKYPDGRKWLIEDGERIEVLCTDRYIYGPWDIEDTDQSWGLNEAYPGGSWIWDQLVIPENNAAVNQAGSLYATEESRDAEIARIRSVGYENVSTNGGVTPHRSGTGTHSEYDFRFIPWKGSSHIKFKQNPYEFYENAPDPEFQLDGYDDSNLRWDAKAYAAWSISVDDSRYGWETW